MTRVTLHHLIGWLKTSVCDFSNGQLLMICFFSWDHRRICRQREMNPGIRHQICLKLGQIHIQCAVESQRSSDWTDNLTYQSVEIGVGWPFDVKISPTYIIDGLVVHHESTIRVLKRGMSRQNWIVRLHDSCRHLWRRIYSELKLRLLPIVDA